MTTTQWMAEALSSAADAAPEPQQTILHEVVAERTCHIDGDYLAYFAAGGDEMPVGTARRVAAERIEAFREMSGSAKALVHLTTSGSTKGERFLAATVKPYQGQRNSGRKPKNWAALRDYLENSGYVTFERLLWHDREADDGMALASFQARDPVIQTVIATKDKDMRMLAGTHIDWSHYTLTEVPKGTYELIGPYDGLVYGHKWFWLQLLQGDAADNIPGLPRLFGKLCGEKGAAKYLDGTTCNAEAFELVSAAYQEHYGPVYEDALVEQACLLWLRGDSFANPADFIRICPLPAAAQRLSQRIDEQRETLNRIHAQAAAHEDAARAEQL
ncbi:phosphodiesterase [Ralstonia pseudosolanacearum]|uniref:phosphodiesterase n=1 Tax=Ralstonia pseudosolanacearum TaxID=1310165 RepID=UPI00190F39E3|nr:phosphodiesterase [Ralstonia pseudosolanacearum]MDO3559430.1 phosphodiesterase [Ralstonia pseudosolanacearum]MDO3579076.1 phosphodiesterase [Ralstonia pseudosolanacearum]MDO3588757.1 phosphodiesterase [Ralstonia pseudosolanacearum]